MGHHEKTDVRFESSGGAVATGNQGRPQRELRPKPSIVEEVLGKARQMKRSLRRSVGAKAFIATLKWILFVPRV